MKNNKTIQRLKIFTSLFIALLIVSYGAPSVFIAGSTQMRPEFVAGISNSPLRFLGLRVNPVADGTQENPVTLNEELINSHPDKQNLDYKPVGKGVYAAEDPVTKEEYIKVEEGTELEKRYVTIEGKQIMIYVPVQ